MFIYIHFYQDIIKRYFFSDQKRLQSVKSLSPNVFFSMKTLPDILDFAKCYEFSSTLILHDNSMHQTFSRTK